MNAKHTPGPWTSSQNTGYGDTRFYIAQADGAPYTPHYSDVATLIAETVNDERKSIQEANARLISAAPELLDVLHEICKQTRHPDYDWPLYLQREVDAVIIKATGGLT